jgi:hypothetical protein
VSWFNRSGLNSGWLMSNVIYMPERKKPTSSNFINHEKDSHTLHIVVWHGLGSQAQKLSKDEVAKYENEINSMISYLEETMNFLGDSTTSALEKEIVFTESWSKIFIDDKVQIEDDLDVNRNTPINKDVQAYLKDIDFFFKWANFKLDLQSIANSTRDDGTVFFKATLTRHLTAKTITDEAIDNMKNRFVEINLDRQNNSLKIASIYTTKSMRRGIAQLVERPVAKLEDPFGQRCHS